MSKNLLKSALGIGFTLLLLLGCNPQPAAEPTRTSAPPTATAVPPTQTPLPPTPTTASIAGKTFTGPLESGSIIFIVSADGLSLEPGVVLSLMDVSCAEGGSVGGFSKVSMKITLPPNNIPIENLAFKYGSDNMFMPGYGMELIGQFDSARSASGTFKYLEETHDPLKPCTLGPYQWTATAP